MRKHGINLWKVLSFKISSNLGLSIIFRKILSCIDIKNSVNKSKSHKYIKNTKTKDIHDINIHIKEWWILAKKYGILDKNNRGVKTYKVALLLIY